jgi:hypothetical protein
MAPLIGSNRPPRPGCAHVRQRPHTTAPTAIKTYLSLRRLHADRAGYLLMNLGLAVVKWPLLA